MEQEEELVTVRNAWKSLGSKEVLRSLNMTVNKKTIYGLLGPSSCGKTTLLNCVLGLKMLDFGHIDVKLKNCREVGYMPQETALLGTFTVDETITFFGQFFGLEEKEVAKRKAELLDIMDLHDCLNRTITDCSGGQQRRVSFLVTLLHDPQLLILDEPTVGLDVVLAERIWNHLLKLSDEGKTIIITTHYIQEAANCKIIGLMRFGRLLEENPPQELMRLYNTTNIEEIFLEICLRQNENQDDVFKRKKSIKHGTKTPYKLFVENTWFDKHRFKALINKNLLNLKTNPIGTVGLFLLPMVITMLYGCMMVSSANGLKLGIVSSELPYGDRLRTCNKMSLTHIKQLNCSLPEFFTCPFVKELTREDIKIIVYDDYEVLARDIEKNRVWGSIEVPKNYTSALMKRITDNMFQIRAEDIKFIMCRIDGNHAVIKSILLQSLQRALERLFKSYLITCGIPSKNSLLPIEFYDPVYGIKEHDRGQGALPGFICSFTFYFSLIYATSSVMMEKGPRLADRIIAGGMTYIEGILAHLIIQVVIICIQNAIIFGDFYVLLGYDFEGSLYLALLLAFTADCVGVSAGFLLTEIFSHESTSVFASLFAVFGIFATGGMVWPQEGMHPVISASIPFVPVASATRGMTSIIIRNFGFTHPFVLASFIANWAWTAFFIIAAFSVHNFNQVH